VNLKPDRFDHTRSKVMTFTYYTMILVIQQCARLFYVRRCAEGIGLSAWSTAVDDVFGKMEDKLALAVGAKSCPYGGAKASLSAFFRNWL